MPVEDSLIAATARRHGLTIVTGNDRDFRRPGLKVFNPFYGDTIVRASLRQPTGEAVRIRKILSMKFRSSRVGDCLATSLVKHQVTRTPILPLLLLFFLFGSVSAGTCPDIQLPGVQ
jgi:hypothetical protein